MTELKFCPDQYVDEISTAPNVSREAFLKRDGAGWKLCPVDEHDAEDLESYPHVPLNHGDTVRFHEYRNFGTHTLDIDDEGKWTLSPEPPTYANCFALPLNFEDMARNIPELIHLNTDETQPGSSTDVEVWYWSDYSKPYTFTIEGETARFVEFVGQA